MTIEVRYKSKCTCSGVWAATALSVAVSDGSIDRGGCNSLIPLSQLLICLSPLLLRQSGPTACTRATSSRTLRLPPVNVWTFSQPSGFRCRVQNPLRRNSSSKIEARYSHRFYICCNKCTESTLFSVAYNSYRHHRPPCQRFWNHDLTAL